MNISLIYRPDFLSVIIGLSSILRVGVLMDDIQLTPRSSFLHSSLWNLSVSINISVSVSTVNFGSWKLISLVHVCPCEGSRHGSATHQHYNLWLISSQSLKRKRQVWWVQDVNVGRHCAWGHWQAWHGSSHKHVSPLILPPPVQQSRLNKECTILKCHLQKTFTAALTAIQKIGNHFNHWNWNHHFHFVKYLG